MRLLELFCGTGGFSRGAREANFLTSLAIDIDPVLTSSYTRNFPESKLMLADVSALSAAGLLELHPGGWDGVVGGPPCQGFSDIGRKDPSDKRRQLLNHFFRLVSELKPKFFVFENVTGLLRAGRREELDAGLCLVKNDYNITGPTVWNAADFGAATSRRRLFAIGLRKDLGSAINPTEIDLFKKKFTNVRDAIADLGEAEYTHDDQNGFDVWSLPDRVASSYSHSMRTADRSFRGHRATSHTEAVTERFSLVKQGDTDKVGRHHRLSWTGVCPTLRAGTGSDRGSYQSVRPIHPELNRVITVREAARLQGFPDEHIFHPTVWHSFRMIGNSVSPLMAEAVFKVIRSKLW
ncbi:DNA cytosine methyltransferase [Rhizobium skierniewicense]|uniref:DNA cytosine methyltransferase n=1 Tax=Rhizobium skierniewicense TaxID=984260 RepID=UPI001FAB9F03|nr:DNA cytosine methyltransferase [Rhizobium skierniewicense]MCI9865559.1 DNA cytosine methyltransferase [Rhizobium skierniewicense]